MSRACQTLLLAFGIWVHAAPAHASGQADATVPPRLEQPGKQLRGGNLPTPGPEIRIGQAHAGATDDLLPAWQALRAGQWQQAEQLYRRALERDPRDIEALTGLATVQQQRGNRQAAIALYRRVLTLQPEYLPAQAALAYLLPGEAPPPATWEAAPDALHAFVYGSWMARRGRWHEARDWFFEASRQDGREPDYAYNLAVSLDRLGQTRLAAEQYRRALQLSQQLPGRFSRLDVLTRLAELELTP